MNVITKKMCAVADKVTNSKVYKGVEKVAVGASATLATVGTMAVSAFAEDATSSTLSNAITAEIQDGAILENAQPFIVPAIGIMCVVGGIKLGMRFFRGAMH